MVKKLTNLERSFMLAGILGAFIILTSILGIHEENKDYMPTPPSVLTLSADYIIDIKGIIAHSEKQAVTLFPPNSAGKPGVEMPVFSSNQFLTEVPKKVDTVNNQLFIRINSVGGSVDEMQVIIDKIDRLKDDGITVTCVVDGIAASAATLILSECSERYATTKSYILWHSVATVVFLARINAQTAHQLADSFDEFNKKWISVSKFFDAEYFKTNFDQERLINSLEVEKESKGKFIKTFDRLIIK